MRRLLLGLLLSAAPVMVSAEQDQPAGTPAPICGSGSHAGPAGAAPTKILTGFGTGGFKITTSSPEAQAWFDYGMALAHAFNHEQATAAFKEAQRRDPTCAMCVWGESWSRGPTINFGIDPAAMKAAVDLADKAAVLGKDGTEREKKLIAALQLRYRNTDGKSGTGDLAFAKAMDSVAQAYPKDSEIAIIAADAWLIRSSLWNDKSGEERSIALLEGVLKERPNDTGAIHFYIHATEMHGVGGKAEAYADHLGALAPFAGHLVHMPAHTFFLVGRYEDAAIANVKASEIDLAYAKATGAKTDGWRRSYHGHNVHFGIGGAMMAGDAKSALLLAEQFAHAQADLKPNEGYLQVSSSSIYYAWGRYEDPAKVLARPQPKEPYAQAAWRYARGEALARLGQAEKVRAEARAIRTDWLAYKSLGGMAQQASDLAEIMRGVLMGRADMLEGRWQAAEIAFRKAADLQDKKFGDSADPPMWWYPVRRSQAAALAFQGRNDVALKVVEASLKRWPGDPLALAIRSRVQEKLGHKADAESDLASARKGWVGDLHAADLRGA